MSTLFYYGGNTCNRLPSQHWLFRLCHFPQGLDYHIPFPSLTAFQSPPVFYIRLGTWPVRLHYKHVITIINLFNAERAAYKGMGSIYHSPAGCDGFIWTAQGWIKASGAVQKIINYSEIMDVRVCSNKIYV